LASLSVFALAILVAVTSLWVFGAFWGGLIAAELGGLWGWVTLSALVASVIAIVRKRRGILAAMTWTRRGRGGGILLVVLGTTLFIVGSFHLIGFGLSTWVRLFASISVSLGLVWTAFGPLTVRLVLLPFLALAFLVAPSTTLPTATWNILAGVGAFLIGAVVVWSFVLRFKIRVATMIVAGGAAVVVGATGFTPVTLVSTLSLALVAAISDALSPRDLANCEVCGEKFGGRQPICLSCARGMVASERTGSLAPLTLAISLLAVASVVSVQLVSASPYGLHSYSMNGETPLSISLSYQGYTPSRYNLTTNVNSTALTYDLVPQSGVRVYNVLIYLRNPVNSSTSSGAGTPLASGVLNGTSGIKYAVVNGTGEVNLILSWSSTLLGEGPNGTSSVVAGFSVTTPYVGNLSRSQLASQLAAPTGVAESLYVAWSGYSTDGLYVYEGEIALTTLSDYVLAFGGAAIIFAIAERGVMADKETAFRLKQLDELSPTEAGFLITKSRDIMDTGPGIEGIEGTDHGNLYQVIRALRSRGILRVHVFPRGDLLVAVPSLAWSGK
jgi:hypothetical protein